MKKITSKLKKALENAGYQRLENSNDVYVKLFFLRQKNIDPVGQMLGFSSTLSDEVYLLIDLRYLPKEVELSGYSDNTHSYDPRIRQLQKSKLKKLIPGLEEFFEIIEENNIKITLY